MVRELLLRVFRVKPRLLENINKGVKWKGSDNEIRGIYEGVKIRFLLFFLLILSNFRKNHVSV